MAAQFPAQSESGGGLTPSWRLGIGPEVVAVLLLFFLSFIPYLFFSGGAFTYPLDDTYIHLAISKTLAQYGVWGVVANQPAAASSSPLWTIILAVPAMVLPKGSSVLTAVPVALNMVLGAAVIVLASKILGRSGMRSRMRRGFVLFLIVVLTPLTPLAVLGMEHVLQILLCTILACAFFAALQDKPRVGPWLLAALAALAVMARYEAAFAVAAMTLLSIARRRVDLAFALLAGAIVPILLLGFYWQAHGGFLLPNSLMLKGVSPASASGIGAMIAHLRTNVVNNLLNKAPSLALVGSSIAVLILALGRLRRGAGLSSFAIVYSTISILCVGALYVFAVCGWLYRYEAWLIFSNILGCALLAGDADPGTAVLAKGPALILGAALAVLLVACLPRAVLDWTKTYQAMDDRRQEHLLPARFVRDYYGRSPVLVNDLGMMAYFTNAPVVDIYGLGNNAPIVMRRQPGGYGPGALQHWADDLGSPIAILTVCWDEMYARVPASWTLVQVWQVPRNVVFADQDVGFFAVQPSEVAKLAANLDRAAPPAQTKVVKLGSPEMSAFQAEIRGHHRPLQGCPKAAEAR